MDAIVAQSEIGNRARDVTGVLISHGGWFVQALEGVREVILDLYAHIAQDVRHEAIAIVSLEAVEQRVFAAWGMTAGSPPLADATRALNMSTFSASALLELLKRSVGADDGEGERLGALKSSAIIDRLPEQQFDDVVLVAKTLTRSDAAAIFLLDGEQPGFRAEIGLDQWEAGPDAAFCIHAILRPEVMWVADTREDARFCAHPLVIGGRSVRFYAGAPLAVGGDRIGALCVFGYDPIPFDSTIAAALEALGRGVSARLAARREERLAASLLSTAADAIICTDADGRMTFVNPSAERMFGYSAEEMMGQPLAVTVPARRRAAYDAALAEFRRSGSSPFGGRSIDVPALRKDGTEFPIEVALAVWGDIDAMGAGVIMRDCSQRKAAERALADAKQAAEAANVAKSAFLANMSHEIRTPLNGVIGVTELLAASGLDEHQAEMAELIRSSGAQLHGLLGDILDIARIEAGEMVLALEPIVLGDVLSAAVALAALKAQEKGLKLELIVEKGLDWPINGDPVRLKQIVGNLVSNAVKFTETGSVTVRARRLTASELEVIVTDTGPGFDPSLTDQLFGRFQQADGSITRQFGGSGLGLAICRQLAELMGGGIECESRPGEGATFRVSLPMAPAAEALIPENQAEDEFSLQNSRLSVLLADDHPTNRRVVELILASLDVELVSVEDGAKALQLFQIQAFDLVLMDMMMPVMDGLAATRAIRLHEAAQHWPRTPVLMLTANALPEHIAAAIAAGADRHVLKPINATQLITAISEELATGRQREEQVVSQEPFSGSAHL